MVSLNRPLLTDPFSAESQEKPRRTALRFGGGEPAARPYADAPRSPSVFLPALLASAMAAVMVTGVGYFGFMKSAGVVPGVEVKPTHDVLVAIKDLSRLELTEVQVEKVVDLADKQKLFGLIETEDAMLLVAAGSATVGVDLEKLGPSDVQWDEQTKTAKLRLPQPQVLSTRLDPDATYVYRRETGILAKRNEKLEARGRKEALQAVERAAAEPDVTERAKKQAERQLTSLLTQLGAKRVEISWKD